MSEPTIGPVPDQPVEPERQLGAPVAWIARSASGNLTSRAQVVHNLPMLLEAAGVQRWCDVGTWMVQAIVPREFYSPKQGDRLLLTHGAETLASGPITRFTAEQAGGQGLVVTLHGITEEHLLADRIIYPDPARAPHQQTTRSHDARSGVASTVMIGYADAHAGPGSGARSRGGLTVAPDPLIGPVIDMRERYSNLLDVLQRAALKAGVGFRVVRRRGQPPVFEVIEPRDRSNSAVFSTSRSNVHSVQWSWEAPASTFVLSGGQGELTARMMVPVGDPTAEEQWQRRIEVFRDQRAEDDYYQMSSDGFARLEQDAAQEAITLEPTSIGYGEAWQLGDIARAQVLWDDGSIAREVTDRITQVAWQVNQAGEVTYTPTIGDDRDGVSLTASRLRAIEHRLNNIEGAQ